MEPFSDGTNGTSHPHGLLYDVRARLQTLLDQKEQELQSAGSLGQRILAQQMELEERINQISELESGRTGLKDDEIESEMRAKLNDLADTMHAWQHENQQLWSGYGSKTSDDAFGTDASAVPEVPLPTASAPDGPSAAQSSRRTKNAQHRANDVEFAFEIGSSLLTEVRRLQALLAERDKAIQDFKEERDDLERTIEGLKTALRQQEANADKYKEENWNLEVKIQDIQNQLSEAQSNAQRAESETKRQNKQLATLRETSDMHKNEAERLAHALEDLKAKHETDVAQMRKTQAGLQREKQDLQTALDALKADMAKKARTPGRFGSPMTPNGGDLSARLAYDFTDEEDDRGVMSARKPRADTSLQYATSQPLSAELSAADPTPDASPIKSPPSGQAAAELDNLKSNLSRAHRQISLLKSRLTREKSPRSAEGKKKSVDLSGEGVWLDEDLGDEVLDVETSPGPQSTSTPAHQGVKTRRSITRSSRGLTVIQQLNAAKTTPDSPLPAEGRTVDLTSDGLEGFGPLSDEPSIFNEDTDDQEEHKKVDHSLPEVEVEDDGSESETEGSMQTQRPESMVSVEGMDPMFANVLKTPSASPAPAHGHAPVTPSPLRRASSITKARNNRATRRSRGGVAFKGTRPPSVHGGKMGALAEELGFGGEEDISTLTQPDQTLEEEEYLDMEREDVPKRVFVDVGVQYEAVEEEVKPAPEHEHESVVVPVPVPVEPVREPTPEPEAVPTPTPEPAPAKETAEFGVQVEPAPLPPVPKIVRVDTSTQTTEKAFEETSTSTDPEPVVVQPVMVEIGTNTSEEWPVIPVRPKTAEMGTETDPIPEPTPAAVVPGQPAIKAPPSSFRDPALYSARADTDGDSETDYEDARETVAATSRSQSAADFVSMHDVSPDEDVDGGDERDSDDDSDAESIKVSRLHYKRPPPGLAAPPSPPAIEYVTASVQADAPKPEVAEIGTQTDEWVPPAPALFRVGPQLQQFQFITPAVAAAAAASSPSSPTQAAHPPVPPVPTTLGPSFQAAIARSRLNTAVTLPEPVSAKDDSGRPRVPSTPTGSPRVDRTRPPTMMLPPPPKLPPPPSLPSTLSPPKAAPRRPSSPPPADLVQRAQAPLQRTPVSSMNNLAVPSPGKSSVIRQAPSTPTSIRQAPSASSFRSAGAAVHHQSLAAAAMADLNGRHKEGSVVSSRRSTSSRRPSISSSISSEQHAVRTVDRPIGSPARTTTGLSSSNGNEYGTATSTDPNIIHSITQTMIGEFLYKYTRKAIGKGHAERRHKRFFWIHPYTKTIYWSEVDPGASNVQESSAKSAYIESVKSVLDPNPMPPGLHQYSVIVSTAQREMKFTAPTKERHDIWFNALNYLLARPNVAPSGSRAPLSPITSNQPRMVPPEAPHRKETAESPRSQRSGRSGNSGTGGENWNSTPRPQRSYSRLSTYPASIGKRAGTPAAEYLHWNGGEPGSPNSAYHQMPDNAAYDDDLDFHIHDRDPEKEGYEGMENVRACCDGAHDVGTLSGRRHHHHHDHPVPPIPPFARSQPGTTRSSSRAPPPDPQLQQQQQPSRPASPSGWSFRSGKSNRGASSREDGTGAAGGGVFSWSKRSRKESAPVR